MSKLSKVLKSVERGLGKLIPHESAASRRANMYAVQEQMSLYQEQKNALHAERDKVAADRARETSRLHEKQIRALKGSYRSRGFMQPAAPAETADTLG